VAGIREALRSGQLVDDRAFDRLYPLEIRRASRVHWTPVEVAVRAARLLADRPGLRLLDIGSGVGKFCIVAAASVNASVTGVEHRRHFVRIARGAAARIGVDITFVAGTLADCDPRDVDGIYLFNPFAENLSSKDHLDQSVELSEERFWRDVESTHRFLHEAPVGTRVVTYCGWGGEMPAQYCLALREPRAGTLELWVKANAASNLRVDAPRLGPTTRTGLRGRTLAEAERVQPTSVRAAGVQT